MTIIIIIIFHAISGIIVNSKYEFILKFQIIQMDYDYKQHYKMQNEAIKEISYFMEFEDLKMIQTEGYSV